jgi:hypothetical protein
VTPVSLGKHAGVTAVKTHLEVLIFFKYFEIVLIFTQTKNGGMENVEMVQYEKDVSLPQVGIRNDCIIFLIC